MAIEKPNSLIYKVGNVAHSVLVYEVRRAVQLDGEGGGGLLFAAVREKRLCMLPGWVYVGVGMI
jgi:hypothetical protein